MALRLGGFSAYMDRYMCLTKDAQICTGHSQYGARGMQVSLPATCPKTLIVTLKDVLESGNAKNRVNLA